MTLAQHLSQSVEWFTPRWCIDAVHDVLGTIELDPASCEKANHTVGATRYFTREEDGLSVLWCASTIFCNPPYGRGGQDAWSAKMISEYRVGHFNEGMLLVNAATGTEWFHRLYNYPLCLVRGRIHFVDEWGVTQHNPTHDNAFIYFGSRPHTFKERFSVIGKVYFP